MASIYRSLKNLLKRSSYVRFSLLRLGEWIDVSGIGPNRGE